MRLFCIGQVPVSLHTLVHTFSLDRALDHAHVHALGTIMSSCCLDVSWMLSLLNADVTVRSVHPICTLQSAGPGWMRCKALSCGAANIAAEPLPAPSWQTCGVQELQDHLTERSWLESTRIVVSNASNTLCLTHQDKIVFWQSASSARLRVEDWQQHGDGMQRVRIHREKGVHSAAVVWVDLSHEDTPNQKSACEHDSHGGQLPDHGALALLFDSGWLKLYNDNGDVMHQQHMFRTDTKQAGHWRPVCNCSNGVLLLTAPNAVYVVQCQDIASALHRHVTGTSALLPVAACPLPGNFNPPRCGLPSLSGMSHRICMMAKFMQGCRDLSSLRAGGSLTEDFTSKSVRPLSDNVLCAGDVPTIAWMQFPPLCRRAHKGKPESAENSTVLSSAIQVATIFAAKSVVGIANAMDGVQGTVSPHSAEATWVIVGTCFRTQDYEWTAYLS